MGLPCSPSESLDFASIIVMEDELYQEYSKLHGHFEYYIIFKNLHAALCIRPSVGEQTHTAGLVELLIRKPNGRDKQWFIQIRQHEWNPNEDGAREKSFGKFHHEWSLATVMDAVAKFAKTFGTYNVMRRNCKDFAEQLKERMIATVPSPEVPSMQWRLLGLGEVPANHAQRQVRPGNKRYVA